MATLNWVGRDAVVNHHERVELRPLGEVPELSCGEPGSGNLIIQGDNLLALKALLAFGVLAVFIGAVRAGRKGTMDPCRFRHTHRVVLTLMVGIVGLAKLMFYA